jgi:S-adenosylmethionine uptake transporter
VGVKVASVSFGTFELIFYRGLVSLIFIALALRVRGITWRTPVPMMHFWRTLIGVCAFGSWFYALAHLPLVTAMTLNYMSSIWLATFIVAGALLYKQSRPQGWMMATTFIGFIGVVLVLQPTMTHEQLFAAIVGLLSGVGAATASLQVGALGRAGEPEERVVFYFSLGTAVLGLLGTLWVGFTPWQQVRWVDALWLVPIGVLASLGQWCATRAYSRGTTLLAANLQYAGVVFAALYNLVLFNDQIQLSSWMGILVIVLCGMAATVLRARTLPSGKTEIGPPAQTL